MFVFKTFLGAVFAIIFFFTAISLIPTAQAGATAKYFKFDFSTGDPGESFIVKVTDSALINQLTQDLNGPRKLIIGGVLVSGNGGYNHSGNKNWSWSFDSNTLTAGENFIEVCDQRPSQVEAELGLWIGQQYCPWGNHVSAVFDTPPSLVVGEIGVSPNPCYIPSGQTTCSANVLWSVTNPQDVVRVRVREANGLLAQANSGSVMVPWASKIPLHMDLYDGTNLLGTAIVQGVDQMPLVSSKGLISSSVNPCILNSGGTCTARISWNAPAYPNVTISLKENPGSLFGAGPSGFQNVPWITAPGATFELRSNNVVVDSLRVKGVNIAY